MLLIVYNSNGVFLGVVGMDIYRGDVWIWLGIMDVDFEVEIKGRCIVYLFNVIRDFVFDFIICSS